MDKNEFKIQVTLDQKTLEQVKAENRKMLLQMKEDSKRSILELNNENKKQIEQAKILSREKIAADKQAYQEKIRLSRQAEQEERKISREKIAADKQAYQEKIRLSRQAEQEERKISRERLSREKQEKEFERGISRAGENAIKESFKKQQKDESDYQKYKESLRKQELNQEKISYNAREKLAKEHADKLRRVDRETESQRKKDDALQRRVQERGLSQTFSSQSGRGFGDAESWAKVGIGIAAVTAAAVAFGNAVIKAWAEQEAANTKLLFALERNQTAFGNLQEQAKRLQETTVFADEQVMEAQSFLAVQGRTEEQIKKTIEAATNLAAVEGTDLMTAVQKLDMTYEGSIGRLGRRIGKLKDLTESELKEGKAIEIVNERYKDYAVTVGNTLTGKVTKLKNAFGELKEAAGKGLLEGFSLGLGDATKGVDGLTKELLVLQKTAEVVMAGIAFTMRVTVVGAIATILTKLDEWKEKQASIDNWINKVQTDMNNRVSSAVNDILSGKRNFIYPEPIGPEKAPEKQKVSRGGSSPKIQEQEKILNLIEQQLEVIKKINDELALNAGITGAEIELNQKLKEAKERLLFLETGLIPMKQPKDISESFVSERNLEPRMMQRVVRQSLSEMLFGDREFATEFIGKINEGMGAVGDTLNNMMTTLGLEKDKFVSGLVSGFDRALQYINLIVSALNAVNTVKSVFSMVTSLAGGIVGGASGGGMVAPMVQRQSPMINVVVQSEIEKTKAVRFFDNYYDSYKSFAKESSF